MIEDRTHSAAFSQVADSLLASGVEFRFQACGRSMLPFIQDGEILHVRAVDPKEIRVCEIVLYRDQSRFKAHRVTRKRRNVFTTRGDASLEADPVIRGEQIVGKITAKECATTGRLVSFDGPGSRIRYALWASRRFLSTKLRGWLSPRVVAGVSLLLTTFIFSTNTLAQQTVGGVALDNANSQAFTVGGSGTTCTAGTGTTWNCSFNHTTNTVIGSTGLLVVGFSLNMQGNGSDSQVTAVSYGGTSMGSPPVNYSPGNNFRVQIYYLKTPATGTKTIAFTVNKTGGQGNPLGLVAGAISLYQVNQTFGGTYPITAFATGTSATAGVTFNGTNKPVNNDGIIDVLAVAQGTIVTPNTSITAPLVFENTRWDAQSGTSGQDVKGHSSSGGGIGATLTMQEGLGASTAWTIAAIAVPSSQPTAVKTDAFSVTQTSSGARLSWHTSGEMHNLGFNLYRDVSGQKIKINPSLIAGSALLMRESAEQHGARTYGWIDRSTQSSGLYWLEDVDVNGIRTLHGPVQAEVQVTPMAQFSSMVSRSSPTLGDFARSNSSSSFDGAGVREARVHPTSTPATRAVGFQLASQRGVKLSVDHEGWYRVTQPELVAAGLSRDVDSSKLHLFAEGVEQAIRVTGAKPGFGADAAIEFYGTGIDTPYTGERVYWLVASDRAGKRIETASAGSSGPAAQSFIQTIELKPRTTYFAALLKEDTDNFFGNVVSPVPDTETINVSNAIQGQGKLVVAMQGITLGQQHDVTVTLNGATLGSVNFADQEKGKATLQIPAGVLINGANTITFTAQLGDSDLSLVDYIHLSFPHSFTAEYDRLKFTAAAGQAITVSGFSNPPSRLVDVSDPERPVAVRFKTSGQSGNYVLSSSVPWDVSAAHTLMALSDLQLGSAAGIAVHLPTNLHSPQAGAEAVMLAAPQFMDQVRPLAQMRQAEGRTVALINVNDVYDEFNFGERTPHAIRNFLWTASNAWQNKPHYLVLAGDGSVDPRNYLGFGFLDFVPTKVVVTAQLKTASDDWFSDFGNTGFAKIATGRLPARSSADMQTIVGKIVGYNNGEGGAWTNQSMLVADVDDPSVSFSQAAQSVEKMLPSNMNVTDVFAGTLGAGTAQQALLAGVNSGKLLVNYNGHGSVEIWGSGLLNDSLASSLTNGTKLPMFVAMNCLNGFFHDVYTQSLATALMLSPNGGAVSVWASSGLTEPGPQFQMDQAFARALFTQPGMAVGDAVLRAKSGIEDSDVRKTFILFGDPMMRLKSAADMSAGGGKVPGLGDLPVIHPPLRDPRAGREME
jgi:hypothetical protein